MGKNKFQAFTARADGRANQIVSALHVSEAFNPQKPPDPPPPFVEVQALWDTGATGSAITEELAAQLDLTPTGKVELKHAGGTHDAYTYLVNFGLPNNVGIAGVRVIACSPQPGFAAIIGMDVMTTGDFSITNVDGKTTMSFRTPSIQTIDYVVEANRIRYRGVGRNSKCPCGSGKKFKKCCEPEVRLN